MWMQAFSHELALVVVVLVGATLLFRLLLKFEVAWLVALSAEVIISAIESLRRVSLVGDWWSGSHVYIGQRWATIGLFVVLTILYPFVKRRDDEPRKATRQ
ncbi:MAG: hypothetical protein WC734_04055 [Patescibacteria group bacterium]|jgi:hypothetical protein